jgi:hypothetical protein
MSASSLPEGALALLVAVCVVLLVAAEFFAEA